MCESSAFLSEISGSMHSKNENRSINNKQKNKYYEKIIRFRDGYIEIQFIFKIKN